MFAASEGLSPVVDLLLEHGADPKMVDIDNESSADFARSRGFPQLADKLQALIDAP
jgi:arabinogalactan endo-1,4-beta-galactosidase